MNARCQWVERLSERGSPGAHRFGRYKTLAMIKPFTATVHYEDIKCIILAHGFEIVAEAHQRIAADRAAEFYAEHEGKDFFPKLVRPLTFINTCG
jgi:nucleoside diphosphate kinase